MLKQYRLGLMLTVLCIGLLLITLLLPLVYPIGNWHVWFICVALELVGLFLGTWELEEVEKFMLESDKTISRLQARNENQAKIIADFVKRGEGLRIKKSDMTLQGRIDHPDYRTFDVCPDCGTDVLQGQECDGCRARTYPGECQSCVESWRYSDRHWRNRTEKGDLVIHNERCDCDRCTRPIRERSEFGSLGDVSTPATCGQKFEPQAPVRFYEIDLTEEK